ncbi:hypothetical protein [Thiocystis violascens]|uniref:hypothetical protein n=1 Tax=Thiocystis violascens TaxID=73141 RepID=UPI00022C27E4|nr:hypothetical protein [Thiocystis violascens]
MTIEQARRQAQSALSTMAEGVSPNSEKKAARVRGVTLGEVFEDYLKARKSLKSGTLADYRKIMNKAFGDWQRKALSDITRDLVPHSSLICG